MRARRSWGRVGHVMDLPYLLQDQKRSYEWFLREGIPALIREISPIKGEGREGLELELKDPRLAPPPYTEQDCKDKNLTYAATLRVKGILKQNGKKLKEDDLYIADIPLMTARGTFIINGRERVIVSQLARSPGIYFEEDVERSLKTMERNLSLQSMVKVQVIPAEGPWIDFEQEPNHVVMA
ncbi:MAG: DNA-directed RNA polymerase subunit beta, partial [Candidatus Bipolaricaulota bacterium]|nr:DNA-directed RNA polymerase subunit beta [Candidatus Bipolaricaulota bacterium]